MSLLTSLPPRTFSPCPKKSVIHSGKRNVVVLDRGDGTFQVKEVKLGANGNGLWEVTRRTRGRRSHRDVVSVPDRFREQPAGSHPENVLRPRRGSEHPQRQDTSTAGNGQERGTRSQWSVGSSYDMLEKIIDWSIQNKFIVILATIFITVWGLYSLQTNSSGRHSRSFRRPSHHLHRLPGTGSPGRRGPGHLPHHDPDAGGSVRQSRAGLLLFRFLVRLRDLRRRNRHVLGAQPGTGVS